MQNTDANVKGGAAVELWDLYDKNRRPLGRLHRRGDTIEAGTYHLVVSVMTINSKGEILLTLRSKGKNPYPDMWEITAGSALSGEDSLQAAKRELLEETGIAAEDGELRLVNTYINGHGSGAIVDMYIIRKDIAAEDIRLQKGETDAAKWVTPEAFDEIAKKGRITPPVVRRFVNYRKYI